MMYDLEVKLYQQDKCVYKTNYKELKFANPVHQGDTIVVESFYEKEPQPISLGTVHTVSHRPELRDARIYQGSTIHVKKEVKNKRDLESITEFFRQVDILLGERRHLSAID